MNPNWYKQVVSDYQLPQEQFEAILQGESKIGNFDQSWAIARVLENLHYYDALKLVPFATLQENWDNVKGKLFSRSIRSGYEFVIHRYSLPSTG